VDLLSGSFCLLCAAFCRGLSQPLFFPAVDRMPTRRIDGTISKKYNNKFDKLIQKIPRRIKRIYMNIFWSLKITRFILFRIFWPCISCQTNSPGVEILLFPGIAKSRKFTLKSYTHPVIKSAILFVKVLTDTLQPFGRERIFFKFPPKLYHVTLFGFKKF